MERRPRAQNSQIKPASVRYQYLGYRLDMCPGDGHDYEHTVQLLIILTKTYHMVKSILYQCFAPPLLPASPLANLVDSSLLTFLSGR